METKNSTLLSRQMLNKVPEITLWFWIIKIMCTTVGETVADYLNVNLNFGLTGTSIITGILLIGALILQFRAKKYIPAIYWITVMLISIFGTLVTDNLTDKIGIPLEISTIIFSILLAITFGTWYYFEKTLSIHSIVTLRREIFYWVAILCTFALGTAVGDLMAEGLALGYATTGIIIATLIAIFAFGWWKFNVNHILSFWVIYILTRPLGASIGDFLSQQPQYGGLGLGVTITSLIFVSAILITIIYLTVTNRDVIKLDNEIEVEPIAVQGRKGIWQTIGVILLFVIFGIIGYSIRHSAIQTDVINSDTNSSKDKQSSNSSLGDLSSFQVITQDTLDILNAGNQAEATKRIGDLEYEWDNAQSRLRPKDVNAWTNVDKKIDTVLRELRSTKPDITKEKSALESLLQEYKLN